MDATPKNTVSGISGPEVPVPAGLRIGKAITGQPPKCSPVEDTVELSPAGIALARAGLQSPARFARMSEIHAAIKAGTFETPERMDGTVERILDILG